MEPDEIQEMTSEQARSGWRILLNDVEFNYDHVVISRYGKPIAAMVPIDWYEKAKADIAISPVAR